MFHFNPSNPTRTNKTYGLDLRTNRGLLWLEKLWGWLFLSQITTHHYPPPHPVSLFRKQTVRMCSITLLIHSVCNFFFNNATATESTYGIVLRILIWIRDKPAHQPVSPVRKKLFRKSSIIVFSY
jgi:hypothetical protein